jgi:hypothetical protein
VPPIDDGEQIDGQPGTEEGGEQLVEGGRRACRAVGR